MWGFATDMRIQGDSAIILQQVCEAVEARADDGYRRRVAERIASWRGAREAAAQKRAAASANKGVSGALNPAFVLATLSGKISQDDVVLNEAIRNGPVLQDHVRRTKPQSYVGLAGGGLGFSGGMALGLKTRAAGAPHRAGDRRRRLSFLLARQRLCRGAAVPDPDLHRGARQWRLAGGEIGRAARLSQGRCGRDRPVPVAPDVGPAGRAARFFAMSQRRSAPTANASPSRTNLAAAIDRCLAALDDGKAAVLHVHVTRL